MGSVKNERKLRILRRNELIRQKFQKLVQKRCYRIDYILHLISEETGMHPDYIRTIVKQSNKTENRIRNEVAQLKIFDNE